MFHFLRIPCSTSRIRCSTSSGIAVPLPPDSVFHFLRNTHKALRETNPLDSTAVRFALQRMHRRRGRRQAQVQGLTWPLRNRLIEATGDRLIDARDRALLAVGYDTLLRRAELVAVKVPDLLEEIDGTATVLVRSGKTDGEGRGATLYLARDTVQLVKTWLEVGGIDEGHLGRSIGLTFLRMPPRVWHGAASPLPCALTRTTRSTMSFGALRIMTEASSSWRAVRARPLPP